MTEVTLYRRLIRRSRHRSRSLAVIVVLIVLAIVAAYVGTESVLAAIDRPPLLISPAAALAVVSPWLALAAIPGVILLVIALAPGRRGRHELPDERMAVLVDDGVLAGALKHAVIRTAGVPAGRVSSMMSNRRSDVRVVPTSGEPLDEAAITAAAEAVVEALQPKPSVRVALRVAPTGVIGS